MDMPKVIQPPKRSPRTNGGSVGSGTGGGERKGRRSNAATSANNENIDGTASADAAAATASTAATGGSSEAAGGSTEVAGGPTEAITAAAASSPSKKRSKNIALVEFVAGPTAESDHSSSSAASPSASPSEMKEGLLEDLDRTVETLQMDRVEHLTELFFLQV